MVIMYTSPQLILMCQQTAKSLTHVSKSVYYDLKQRCISHATPTHRVTTGGQRQCQCSKTMQPADIITTGLVADLKGESVNLTQGQPVRKELLFSGYCHSNSNCGTTYDANFGYSLLRDECAVHWLYRLATLRV